MEVSVTSSDGASAPAELLKNALRELKPGPRAAQEALGPVVDALYRP